MLSIQFFCQTTSDLNGSGPSIDLSDSEVYTYELKTNNAISLCNNTLKTFVLQDFCLQSKSLKVTKAKIELHLIADHSYGAKGSKFSRSGEVILMVYL